MKAELADEGARERIRTDLGATLFVDAGAGTGKTAALVDRVTALVLAGAEMRHVAAITFTEAAAAELADRVRAALEDVARAGGPPAESAWRALDQLDDAALTTIHGFARRLLAEHPFSSGLPPVLEVVDGLGQALQTEEWWRDTLAELLRDRLLQTALERAFVLGLTIGDLRSLAMAMHSVSDRVRAVASRPAAGRLAPPDIDVDAVAGPVREALAVPCTDEDDRLCQHLQALHPVLEALLAETDPLERLRLLDCCGVLSKHNAGVAGNWRGRKTWVLDRLEEAEEARQTQLENVRSDVLGTLLPALAERVVAWGLSRRAAGRPQFHDLLVWSRDLLHDHPEVRHLAADRWRYLLVDEFQDVDPLQAELAALLAGEDEGRLFVVGDPKQSIYRFRGADIALYLSFQDRHSGGLVRLTTSFRSVPGVIDWSNAIFSELLAPGDGGDGRGGQAEHVPLELRRRSLSASPSPPPVLVVGGRAEPRVQMREVRREESIALVELIRRMRTEGWPVADGSAERAVRYADIALLIPTRAALPALERALEESDVPFRIESRSLVFATDEVRTVLHVLAAVDDPGEQVAVVGALRSPALACTDKELLEWRQAGGRWDWRAGVPSSLRPDHAVARAMAQLQALAELRWSKSVGELAGEVVGRLRLLDLSLAHRRPRDHWRRLRFIVDQARAYDDGGGRTVREFVSWARQQAEEGATVNEAVVPESDDDAVRILTMHGAKGLEFPVVVLAGLGTKPTRRPSPVLFDDDGGFEARMGAATRAHCDTSGYAVLHGAEQEAIRAEELRLLYVAATRARDRLVVGLHHLHKDKESIAHRLLDALATCPERWSVPPPAQPVDPVAPVVPPPIAPQVEHGAEWLAAWAEHRARLVTEGARAPVTAATRLAADIGVAPERGGHRRLGTAVGRAVHAVLQTVDLASGDGVDAQAGAQAQAEGIPDEAATVAALVRSLLASSPVRQAATGRHWREVYVAAGLEGTLLEGFVDLLYEAPEGLVVVDFKTDAAVDAAVGRYRLQLAAYAAALEALLGRPVARCTLVFADAHGGDAQVKDVDDLPQAVAEVRTLLAGRSTLAVPAPSAAQGPPPRPVQQVLFDLPMAGAVAQ